MLDPYAAVLTAPPAAGISNIGDHDTWGPSAALRNRAQTAASLKSTDVPKMVAVLGRSMRARFGLDKPPTVIGAWEAEAWGSDFLVLADQSFSQMLLAAAATAPSSPVMPDELVSPSGVFIFSELVTVDGQVDNLRAITWRSLTGPTGRSGVQYALWQEQAGVPHLVVVDADVFPLSNASVTETLGSPYAAALLRSVKVIVSSSHTEETIDREHQASGKRISKKSKRSPSPVRILRLHNPAYGTAELNAATGRKNKLHWVRGHWRSQWYPSLDGHRSIWVDGHPRGDLNAGIVEGERLYVAKGASNA